MNMLALRIACTLLLFYSDFFPIPATWGGAKLCDVLELVGIPKLTSVTSLGGKHVEFVSVDKCKVRMSVLIS
jgi:hypothetical protein